MMEEINASEDSDQFYNEAVRFYKSGNIVSNSHERLSEDTDLFSPVIFLYRHALELILKALIIKVLKSEEHDNWIKVKTKPHNRTISTMHSIKALYETWALLDSSRILAAIIEQDFLDLIERIDDIDFVSTFFRYPYDKNGHLNRKNLTEDVRDLMTGMPCSLGNFMYHEGLERFSCLHREQELDYLEEDIPLLIQLLSNAYTKKD